MRSRVTFLRHPLHPMLVMFPVALLPLLLIFDLVAIYGPGEVGLWTAGFVTAAVGGVLTVLAIAPGIMDLAAIPNGSRAHKTAIQHLVLGLVILVVYAVTVWLRWPMGAAPGMPMAVLATDAVGTLAVGVQGWLGGQLVYKHHVGVVTAEEGGEPTPLESGPGLHVPPPRRTGRGRHAR